MLRLVLSAVLAWSACPLSSARAEDYSAQVGFPPPELEPRPKNGIAAVIVGAVLLGAGAESFPLIGLCDRGLFWDSARACRIGNASVGAIGVAVGASVLALGVVRRKRYKAWREARSRNPHALDALRVTPLASGSGIAWGMRF